MLQGPEAAAQEERANQLLQLLKQGHVPAAAAAASR
jgi:hypothetical protein